MFELINVLVAFSGTIFGYLLSKYIPEEMKDGKKYFIFAIMIILAVLIVVLAPEMNFWLFLLGLLLVFLISNVYVFLGIAVVSQINSFLVLTLVFLHGLPYGSLTGKKGLMLSFYFFVPFLLLFIPLDFTSLATGGLIGILIKMFKYHRI